MKPTPTTKFEFEVCSRCGGSGHYSYNQINGSTCFGCAGAGYRLTRRGRLANQHMRELLSVTIDQLKVGDVIQCEDLNRRYYAPVVEIVHDTESTSSSLRDGVMVPNPPFVRVTTQHARYGRFGVIGQGSHKVRKQWTREETEAALAQALAYQSTLTKSGHERKRA